MSFTTKMRLSQMTGSIGSAEGQVRDDHSAEVSSAIAMGDLGSMLSHMASAIKRIHGADSFTEAAAGTFEIPLYAQQQLFVTGTAEFADNIHALMSLDVDGDITGSNLSLSSNLSAVDGTFSGDLSAVSGTFSSNISAVGATLSADLAAVNATLSGDLSAVSGTFSGDIAAVDATLSGDLSAVSGTFSSNISAVGATLSADLAAVNATLSGDLSAVSGTFSGDISAVDATLSGDLSAVSGTFSSNISAVGATLSADLAAVNATLSGDLSAVDGTFSGDIDAVNATLSGDLSAVSGTFSSNISAVGATLSADLAAVNATLSGDLSAVDGTFSGDLSAVDGNFSGDVVITGDLTVQGTTTTLDTVNLLVEDPIVLFGSNAVASNSNGGIAILSGSSVANESLVFGRVANDVWGVGRKDVEGGTVATLADMTLVAFRADKLEVGSAADYIHVTGSDMNIIAAGDIMIDPAGGDVFFDAPIQPKAGEIHDLGKDGNAWRDLWLRSSAKMTFGAGNSKGVIEHAMHDGAFAITVPSGSLVAENKLYVENIMVAKDQAADPASPTNGYGAFYVKNDKPYFKNDVGSVWDLTAGSSYYKAQHAVTASVAANTAVAIGAVNHGNAVPEHLDVYVNGNLLLSGALPAGSVAAGADYSIDGLSGAEFKFAFGLEPGDVVVVKKIAV